MRRWHGRNRPVVLLEGMVLEETEIDAGRVGGGQERHDIAIPRIRWGNPVALRAIDTARELIRPPGARVHR